MFGTFPKSQSPFSRYRVVCTLAVVIGVLAVFFGVLWLSGLFDVIRELFRESEAEFMVVLTLLLVFGTAFLADYTRELWKTTKAAAEDELNHLKEVSRLELRAYVGVRSIQLAQGDQIILEFVNAGRTPAMNLSYWVKTYWGNMTDFRRDAGTATSVTAVPPNGVLTELITLNRPSVRETIEHVQKEHIVGIYVYGHIQYDDIFGRRWETQYQFEWPQGGPTKTNWFIPSLEGNTVT